MNRLLIVGILIISTVPVYAQRQQQNVAELKEDARNAVGVIGADKQKTRTFCQILELEHQQADEENNKNKKTKKRKGNNKTEVLSEKIDQLRKQLGPESVRLDVPKADIPRCDKSVVIRSPRRRSQAALVGRGDRVPWLPSD